MTSDQWENRSNLALMAIAIALMVAALLIGGCVEIVCRN